MIGLDTNVIVRYLTRDDETQWQQSKQLIQSGEQCFITNIVVREIIWVLKGSPYKYSRSEILSTIETMLHTPTFEFENRSAIYQALHFSRLPSQHPFTRRRKAIAQSV